MFEAIAFYLFRVLLMLVVFIAGWYLRGRKEKEERLKKATAKAKED